ncbi:MAG TPA: zf-HC2 domain-containing protein [Candidatus Polarisedimenticolia bacterium]|nr:zf-HC2 domain-containing protein [Candidatus Polarisedimenticolia bacterium]
MSLTRKNRSPSRPGGRRHDCQEVIGLLTEYLEGDLTGETKERLERHLKGCGPCGQYFETLKRTTSAVATLRCESIPGELHARLRAFLRLRDGAARLTDG